MQFSLDLSYIYNAFYGHTYIQNKCTSFLCNFVPNFRLRKFGHARPASPSAKTSDDNGSCGQVLLTPTDDRRLLITFGVHLCAQRDGRLGVMQRRAVRLHQLI